MSAAAGGGAAVRSRREDFDVVSELGAGSFGTVYKVRRHADGGTYVMKTVRIAELTDRERVEAINEVKLLASIDCPYIVRYFDSFIQKDSLSIIMEFCNKGDLNKLIKKAKVSGVTSLRDIVIWNLSLQILLGLQYLHSMKVLHRDLKSANVFLSKDGTQKFFAVKIGDLGVAKLLDTSTAFARTIVGTPYYLSPELCADQPYRDKSDVWAFGVLLYECCSFRHPFEANNQCALILKIIQSPFAPLPRRDELPPDLVHLIEWTLQKDPSARPTVRDILCESTVRHHLAEHGFAVPEELEGAPLLHILPSSVEKLAAMDVTSQQSGDRAATYGTREGGQQTRVASGGKGHVAPSKVPVKPVTKASVRGDRVRGTTKAFTSQKARMIHQRSAPQLQRTHARNDPQSGYVNEEQEADSKMSPADRDLIDALRSRDVDLKDFGEDKNAAYEEEFEDTLVPGLQRRKHDMDEEDDDNPYAEDTFEAPDDEAELIVAPDSPDAATAQLHSELRSEMKYADALLSNHKEVDLADMHSEAKPYRDPLARSMKEDVSAKDEGDRPQWGSMWSINRGDLQSHGETGRIGDTSAGPANPRELMDFSALAPSASQSESPAESMYITLAEPSVVALSDQREVISRMLHEATDRSVQMLGPELYEQIYSLCLEHMAVSSNTLRSKTGVFETEDSGTMVHSDAKLIEELEHAMKTKLNGSVELACEAVLGIKVILALESRLEALDEAMSHES